MALNGKIHPTAIVSEEAILGDEVEIGPYSILEGPVRLGNRCKIATHVRLIGPLRMGENNTISTGVVIGDAPQHGGYRGELSRTEIGDNNTFREHMTVHRGSHVAGAGVTKIGSNNYFMVNSHIAHDCTVGDYCTVANGALIAGHCELHDRIFLSGNTAVHQFVRMGRLSLISGCEAVSRDVIPFVMVQSRNRVTSVNVVGMKRAGYSPTEIAAARKAFHLLYRSNLILKLAIEHLRTEMGNIGVVVEILNFIATSKRGILRGLTESEKPDTD